MKGIAHFASAVAVASFLPQVVERSEQGSFVLLCAGLGGLMPDVLDFRLARFLSSPDVEIDVHSSGATCGGLDAQAVAERLAKAVERASCTGRPVYVRLGTVKLGADLWQRYSVRFDEGQVLVRVGPSVDGSQTPLDAQECVGWAAVAVPMEPSVSRHDGSAVVVDVFSGTALEFRPCEGRVEIVFLPWHRHWSHSLILAACLGGAVALLFGPLVGWAYALGSLAHILEDQLGYMGCNMFYPFSRTRVDGLGLFHSGDAVPNLFVVWLSAVLLLLNLDRFSSAPVLAPWRWFLGGVVIPWGVIGALWWLGRRRLHDRSEASGVVELKGGLRPGMLVDVSQDGERGDD